MNADERGREAGAGRIEAADTLVRVTVTVTRGQHRALKRLARDEGVTVSALVRGWARQGKESKPLNNT